MHVNDSLRDSRWQGFLAALRQRCVSPANRAHREALPNQMLATCTHIAFRRVYRSFQHVELKGLRKNCSAGQRPPVWLASGACAQSEVRLGEQPAATLTRPPTDRLPACPDVRSL